MSDDKLMSALNILRRMPPSAVENSLAGLIELVPELTDDLLSNVDQPLSVEKDAETGRNFVLCDYNRDGDSYRSPWSNKYQPELPDGFLPSDKLRQLELEANQVFDAYRKQYFDTGDSSVYFFDTEEKGGESFGACWLIHKDVPGSAHLSSGVWDSIHVFEVAAVAGKANTFEYKLTTTCMVSMLVDRDDVGKVDLSGSMTMQSSNTRSIKTDGRTHISNMGTMIEDLELRIRNHIEIVYIQKTREVFGGMRHIDANRATAFDKIQASLAARVAEHGKKE